MEFSALQKARYGYRPKLPAVLDGSIQDIQPSFGSATESVANQSEIKQLFKHNYGAPIVTFEKGTGASLEKSLRLGVILSGGQAPGGHNVITGLYDAMKKANSQSTLIGFLGGPGGLVENESVVLDEKIIDAHRNTGGVRYYWFGADKDRKP